MRSHCHPPDLVGLDILRQREKRPGVVQRGISGNSDGLQVQEKARDTASWPFPLDPPCSLASTLTFLARSTREGVTALSLLFPSLSSPPLLDHTSLHFPTRPDQTLGDWGESRLLRWQSSPSCSDQPSLPEISTRPTQAPFSLPPPFFSSRVCRIYKGS